jgi:putative Mg2+ transporter-C (MgtC) family protein
VRGARNADRLLEGMDIESITKGASVSEVIVRLFVALLAGGLIGWDRERLDKPAGLRTHMLVGLGSCTFTLLGFEVSGHLAARNNDQFDPTRVLQGVVGGIGFLGAGTIIQSRGHVSGVTTAASVWVSGALGAAAGVGAYVLVAASTVLAFLVLVAVGLSQKIGSKNGDAVDSEPANAKPSEPKASDAGKGKDHRKRQAPPA